MLSRKAKLPDDVNILRLLQFGRRFFMRTLELL